jgi:hypothetical protein
VTVFLIFWTSIAAASPVQAATQVTSWTGSGASSNDDYSWTDPGNWDNGVPTPGAAVTIAPGVPTHILDVPSISLASLDLAGSGLVPYDLQVAQPAQGDEAIAITDRFDWRSGTIGEGLSIDIEAGAKGFATGNVQTQDQAVLNGRLMIEGYGSFEVGVTGPDLPTGLADATFRIGPKADGGEVFISNTDWPMVGGTFLVDDGAWVVSDQPASPGLIFTWVGQFGAAGPAAGATAVGGTISDVDLYCDHGSVVAVPEPGSADGVPGGLRLLDVRAELYGTNLEGGGSVTVGGASTIVLDAYEPMDFSDGTTLHLGASGDATPVTVTDAWFTAADPGEGEVVWENAILNGAKTVIEPPLTIVDGPDPANATHAFNHALELGDGIHQTVDTIDGSTVRRTTFDPGTVTILPGTSVEVQGSARVLADVSNQGTLALSADAEVQGEFKNGGTVDLGLARLAVFRFTNQASGLLRTTIDSSGSLGSLSAGYFNFGGSFEASSSLSDPMQSIHAVVISGSFTGTSFDHESLPGAGWSHEVNGGYFWVHYVPPIADLAVDARAPSEVSRGEIYSVRIHVSNEGPSDSDSPWLRLRSGVARILDVSGFLDCASNLVMRCTLSPIAAGDGTDVRVLMRAIDTGHERVRVRVQPRRFDPALENNAAMARTHVSG